MNWVLFSFFGAFFQALENAIKKKALQSQGMNNVIAVIAYLFAGALIAMLYFFYNGTLLPETNLSLRFWYSIIGVSFINAIAVWFNYKALDAADLSYLMPFMTLTSLSLIIPPMFLLGEFPSGIAMIGITIIVVGALMMDWKRSGKELSAEEVENRRNNHKGILYFLGTAACYTFTPTIMKISIIESNVLFATYLVHLMIGVIFIPLIFLIPVAKGVNRKNNLSIIRESLKGEYRKTFLLATLAAGVAIAIANGSINFALNSASVAEVFAIKRTMPLFAFIIAIFYFKERKNLIQKIIATTVMVIGAIIITLA